MKNKKPVVVQKDSSQDERHGKATCAREASERGVREDDRRLCEWVREPLDNHGFDKGESSGEKVGRQEGRQREKSGSSAGEDKPVVLEGWLEDGGGEHNTECER